MNDSLIYTLVFIEAISKTWFCKDGILKIAVVYSCFQNTEIKLVHNPKLIELKYSIKYTYSLFIVIQKIMSENWIAITEILRHCAVV